MATRASVDDKLAALRSLRGRELTPEEKLGLRKYVGDRSNLVVAAASALAGENGLTDLARDLEAAFDRFLVDTVKTDKLCRAKLAVVQALDRMEHPDSSVFEKAARHIQMEPVWGGQEDSAPPLRAAGLVGLARVEGTGSLATLVDALVDPAREVRTAAVVALGAVGGEAAGLALRLKARIGDADPDVFSECLGALLSADPKGNLPLVVTFLNPSNPSTCEAAALALGRSRLPEALDPLKTCFDDCPTPDLRRQILLAIAILRRPGAPEYLTELVAGGPEPIALAAISALRVYKADPRVRERVEEAVRARKSPKLRAGFDQDFGPDDEA